MKEVEIPTIEEIRQKTLTILKSYGATGAGVFGSVVGGKARQRSDIDIEFHITKLTIGHGLFTSRKLLLLEY